uniref:Putative Phage/plasmid primase P4, C-terminal n=1 Tax=mine drainage metagenome TaxID=410659 RepID=E6PNL2_9ZZZZ
MELRDFERGLGLCYLVKCDFDSAAQAPTFHRFVDEILPDDATKGYVQEYAGYTLMPDTRFQAGMWWLGSGANGKSTLVEILAALHSKISAVSLDSLEGFALVSLIGSSLAWVDETPRRINEQRLKTLISGGLVQIDRKFRDPINLKPFAKWIICGNELPAISDQTHGFWRRFAIVDFKRQFSDIEKDPLLARKIIEGELSGVLNWALAGLLRLTQRGRFPAISQQMRDVLASGQRESNNVLAWWQDERGAIAAEGKWTPRGDVYMDYRFHAQSSGTLAVSEERFWTRLKQIAGPELQFKDKKLAGKKIRMANLDLPRADEWERQP